MVPSGECSIHLSLVTAFLPLSCAGQVVPSSSFVICYWPMTPPVRAKFNAHSEPVTWHVAEFAKGLCCSVGKHHQILASCMLMQQHRRVLTGVPKVL